MKKILVVEDEAAIREAILEMLEMEGFEGVPAKNGVEGLNLARSQAPDLIICDVMMPEMNGHDLLGLLREDPTTAMVPLIFLTANVDKTERQRGVSLGANDYLTKPFTQTELLNAIQTQLQ